MMVKCGHGDMLGRKDFSTGCTLRKSVHLVMVIKSHNSYQKELNSFKRMRLRSIVFLLGYTIAMYLPSRETFTTGVVASTVCSEMAPTLILLCLFLMKSYRP